MPSSWLPRSAPCRPRAPLAGIETALDVWRQQGAEISEVILPSLAEYQACCFVILVCEAFSLHEPWMRSRFNDYGELLRSRMVFGALMAGTDYVQAQRRRRELCAITAEATKGIDILVTAGAPAEAPRIDAVARMNRLRQPGYTNPGNVLGWPAMSLCSGFGEGGLPVSVQIMAKPFQEPLLFRAGHAFETATPFRDRHPDLAAVPRELTAGLAAAGLNPPASDLAGMAAVVHELAESPASLKGLRSYANEPASAFHLPVGTAS